MSSVTEDVWGCHGGSRGTEKSLTRTWPYEQHLQCSGRLRHTIQDPINSWNALTCEVMTAVWYVMLPGSLSCKHQ